MSWTIVFDIILFVIFITTAVLITISSVNLYSFKDLPNFSLAYHYSTWASVISWLIVVLFIVAVVGGVTVFIGAAPEIEGASLLTNEDTIGNTISGAALIFLLFLLLLIFAIGILSALTATSIAKTNVLNPQQEYAYHTAIGAAVLALASSSIVFLWWIVDSVYYWMPPEKTEVKPSIKEAVVEQAIKKL